MFYRNPWEEVQQERCFTEMKGRNKHPPNVIHAITTITIDVYSGEESALTL